MSCIESTLCLCLHSTDNIRRSIPLEFAALKSGNVICCKGVSFEERFTFSEHAALLGTLDRLALECVLCSKQARTSKVEKPSYGF